MLNEKERNELKHLAKSSELNDDMRILLKARYNPFVVNGNVDTDKFLMFLSEYNHFINHIPKPWRKIIDNDMRL